MDKFVEFTGNNTLLVLALMISFFFMLEVMILLFVLVCGVDVFLSKMFFELAEQTTPRTPLC